MIKEAIDFANERHKNQKRKGSNIPYIFHLIDTANNIAQVKSEDDELIVSAILHDSVEDAGVSLDEIEDLFGSRVSYLVKSVSEPDKTKSWQERKLQTIQFLKNAEYDVLLLECADKLSNIKSILIDMQIIGDKIWDVFKEGYEKQKWYYNELVKSMVKLQDNLLYIEFCETVNKVFNN